MNTFLRMALFVIPVATILFAWTELVVTDRLDVVLLPIAVGVLTLAVSLLCKDWAHAPALRAALLGCTLASLLVLVLVCPRMARDRFDADLAKLDRATGAYAFASTGTMANAVIERHYRESLKIALPIGALAGSILGLGCWWFWPHKPPKA